MGQSRHAVNRLVRGMGVPVHEAAAFADAAHDIVEELITDDVAVVAPPLVVGRLDCPVLDRLRLRLQDPRWTLPESLDVSCEQLAAELLLPLEVVEGYPIVGRFGLLAAVMDRLGYADDDAEWALGMLDTWLQTWDPGADDGSFAVSPTGTRDAFRDWLVDRIGQLGRDGYAVRLATEDEDGVDGLDHVFDDGRRPDLVLRVLEDGDRIRTGDWLVVSHKVTAVGDAAGHELASHVDWLRAELEAGEGLGGAQVHGLLIADGASLRLERALRERRFGYLSLSSLGYRRWVRSKSRVPTMLDPDATAIGYPVPYHLGPMVSMVG